MAEQNKNQQQDMNKQQGVKKTNVGQQPAQPQKDQGQKTGNTGGAPMNNPNIRK